MEPKHRFCKSEDGTEIGYTKLGEGPPLIGLFPSFSDFDTLWKSKGGPEFARELARRRTFIVIDKRGGGLSQRDVDDVSLEAQVTDVEAVVATEKIEKIDLIGGLDGCAVALSYAANNPARVGRLVLWGPYARYDFRSPERIATVKRMLEGDGWSMVRRALADATYPTGAAEERRTYSQLMKASISAETYAKILDFETSFDITNLLPRVSAPVLVLHRKESRVIPVAAVRAVVSSLPNAELLLVAGDVAAPWVGSEQFIGAIDDFLGASPEPPAIPAERASTLATVIFTDLVGHTEMMSRLGDERGRDVLREHERITREVLKAHGGTEVKTMGDGFMASFGSVTKAVECAIALQRAFGEREGEPLSVRVGLNAGEPIEEDGDLFGATVILASRIAAKAEGGEILVADPVRGLCSGKGFLFADRGEFVAKGFEEPVRVYEVSWREATR
jgi:class 3 adenylate cyclase/pimeloyl-ACP methyl ester carboxylesterase